VEVREAEAVIPSRRNPKEQREIDRNLYADELHSKVVYEQK